MKLKKFSVVHTRIEAIHCEWRSSVVLDVRHVGLLNPYFNTGKTISK